MPSGRSAALAGLATAGLLAAALAAGVSCNRAGGRGRPTVVLYCSADQAIAEPIIAAFEQQCGFKVLARYDTEASKTVGLVQRLRAEAGAPVADVFWSSEVFYTIRLAREGLLAPYSGEATGARPERLRDPQGRWHGFALRVRAIAYHTGRVAAAEAPRRLEDLLGGKWKGRVVLASPQFGTTGGDVASWFAHYGPQRAEEILHGLKANRVRLVDGNSTVVRMLATGRADVGLTDTDDVYAGRGNGWPIAMNPLDQGGGGVLAIPNTVAMIKGAPHPDGARKLVEFLLGERAERLLAESDSHNTPVRASLARQFPQYRIGRCLDVTYDRVADALPSAIAKAREILH